LPSCNEASPSGNPITTTLALQKCNPVNGLTNSQNNPVNGFINGLQSNPVNGLINGQSNPVIGLINGQNNLPSGERTQPRGQITKPATELYNTEERKQEMNVDLGQMLNLPRIKQETRGTMENQRNYFLNGKTPSEAGIQQFSTGINQPSIGFGKSFSGLGSFLDSHVDRAKGGEMDRAIGNTITTKPKNN